MPNQTIEQKIKDLADRAYCRNCLHYIRVNYCSEPDCEENHGPGHCVPLDAGPVKLPKFEFPKITITDDECTLHRKIW